MAGLTRSWLQNAQVRHAAVVALDGLMAALSLILAVYLRIGGNWHSLLVSGLLLSVPIFTVIALAVFHLVGLYRRVWRYTSLSDIVVIVQATTLSIGLLLIVLLISGNLGWMPRSIPVIQWFVLVVLLGGTRMVRRIYCEHQRARNHPAPLPATCVGGLCRRSLLVGSCDRVETVLRLLEGDPEAEFRPIGILDDSGSYVRMNLRGVPILGSTESLEHVVKQLEAKGERPDCLILTEQAEHLHGSSMLTIVTQAESLGLKVACLPKLAAINKGQAGELDLRFIDMAELLGRPQAVLDSNIIEQSIVGRRVLVTGAGGTIGSELVRQIAGLRPSKLILLECSEFNLYNIDLELQENHPDVPRAPVLCSIRQRQQVMQVFAEHRPDIVFHAAALKHVPLVEQHPCAGVQTNVMGTRNVADAARAYGAMAMVQVSTDKAVNPVGLMGATKRLGELYCQALDLEGQGDRSSARFLTVRFGNVIGSSGSLIPLFQRQLRRGAALTVTHPDIQRYFMTVHEAVQLILQSTARALSGAVQRGRIFVLDMGEPVKIIDIARRMIRLAGLEPEKDVRIDIVGLRPGEKLYEELFNEGEERLPSSTKGIFEANPAPVPLAVLNAAFDELANAASNNDVVKTRTLIAEILSDEHKVQPETFQFMWAAAIRTAEASGRAVYGRMR